MRVATDDLAEIQDMIRDLNGSVEPEKQSLWQRLKGKLANFIELSHLAAEEMRIEAEEMAASGRGEIPTRKKMCRRGEKAVVFFVVIFLMFRAMSVFLHVRMSGWPESPRFSSTGNNPRR